MSKRTMGILKKCSSVFSVLQDENRQQILVLLFDKKEMGVNEIADNLPISRPAVSHHLKLLLDAELVTVRKSGKERYYQVRLEKALVLLKELISSIENDMK